MARYEAGDEESRRDAAAKDITVGQCFDSLDRTSAVADLGTSIRGPLRRPAPGYSLWVEV
jgi:hypothetical protein